MQELGGSQGSPCRCLHQGDALALPERRATFIFFVALCDKQHASSLAQPAGTPHTTAITLEKAQHTGHVNRPLYGGRVGEKYTIPCNCRINDDNGQSTASGILNTCAAPAFPLRSAAGAPPCPLVQLQTLFTWVLSEGVLHTWVRCNIR
jgi:hypothetical protein